MTPHVLDRMSTGRLHRMLSRIARETQEIKELEQQLTDGEQTTDQSEPL